MLVWGGEDSAGGAAYDPQSDAWTAMTTVGQPSARSGQVALWTGSELLVWGGLVGEGTTLDGGLFVLSP
jgi:hypothetical protein